MARAKKIVPVQTATVATEPVPVAAASFMELDAPIAHATAFQAFVIGMDVLLAVTTPCLGSTDAESGVLDVAKNKPVGVIVMSPYACKDLALMLTGVMEKFEKMHGPIVTDFSKRLVAENAKQNKNH